MYPMLQGYGGLRMEEKKKGLPSFEELRKVDVTKFTKKRDGADYLNWATCKQLLQDNGAQTVYFEPVIDNETHSSLIMSKETFVDKDGKTNRCYETRIKIVIDDLVFEIQGPVMNGGNPVKDNSMTQQRLWNSQCRLFVKGVAIRTGLGFDLWQTQETKEDEDAVEDLSKHNILKVAERVKEKLTSKMQLGLTLDDIAEQLNLTQEELMAQLSYYATLDRLEKGLDKVDKKQR